MYFMKKSIKALTALSLVNKSFASLFHHGNENEAQARETMEACNCDLKSMIGQEFSCKVNPETEDEYTLSFPVFGTAGDTCVGRDSWTFPYSYLTFYNSNHFAYRCYWQNDSGNSGSASMNLYLKSTSLVNDGECKVVEGYQYGIYVEFGCWVCSKPEWDGSWYITYDSADLADGVLTSTYLTKPGVDASANVTVTHSDGTCASGGAAHDKSVITNTTSTVTVVDDTIDDKLDVAKTLNAAVIASSHNGTFLFCETVTLTNNGLNVVDVQTEYTVKANFLATFGTYNITLEDDSSVTTVDEQTMSVDGTVVVARCGGATENINQGDILCLEISETDSDSVGVQSIYNLDLEQETSTSTFIAIDDGDNKYIDLVDVDCVTVPGTCTVNVVVPDALFVNDNVDDATTFTLNISGDVYLYEMNGKDSESEPKGFGISVKLEKPCEGGFLRGVAEMLFN